MSNCSTLLGLANLTFGFAQEYLIPEEYVHIMRESMLNRCPHSSYDQVHEVVKKELGGAPDEVCFNLLNSSQKQSYGLI